MKKLIGISLMVVLAAQMALATAATAPVNTPSRSGMESQFGVLTNTIIYAGTIVALNSAGYAVPAADASGYQVVGRAKKTVDNRDNNPSGLASSSGAQKISVERGVFGWSTGTTITVTSIGSLVFVSDDNTVTTSGGSYNIIAGTVVDVSGGYAWVDTFNIGRTAGSFTTLAASGAATLSSTLTVTGGATLNGGLTMDSTKFTVADTSGNTLIGGTLGVTGLSSLGALTTIGTTSLGGTTVAVTNNATVAGTLAVTGVATFSARPAYTVTTSTAPTNASIAVALPVTINGTNYLLSAYAN